MSACLLPPPERSHFVNEEKNAHFELSLLLPEVENDKDACVGRLQILLENQKGVSKAHVEEQEGRAVLCLHYDPNLLPLERLRSLTAQLGAEIADRYRHEILPLKGMTQGTNVASIEAGLRSVPGVLEVVVNYVTEMLRVEYDTQITNRDAIVGQLKKMGYRVPEASLPALAPHLANQAEYGSDEPSGSAPHEHQNAAGEHAGHSHSHDVDPKAGWFRRNPELSMALLAGALLLVGWVGERFLDWPRAVVLTLYIASYLAGGADLARHTLPTVIRGRFDVEFLMLVAAAGAAVLGDWAEGAFLLFLFAFGHALEHFATERARNAIEALGKLTPRVARVRRDGKEIEIAIEELQVGDIAIIRPGDRVAVDGKITEGQSAVDQSPITGESVPVDKVPGDGVFAGSINGEGALVVEVSKLAKDSTMSRVIKLVEEAQTQKSPTQTFTDRFERVFVPVVMVTIVLTAVVPPLAGWLSWADAIRRALSTLVAASPCALALATPSAVLAGIAQAARNGVLIKGGVHLENLGTLSAIAFDKTGTITRGKPEVTDIVPFGGLTTNELVRLSAAVEAQSSHPLAQSVVRKARELNIELPASGAMQSFMGKGVEAEVDGKIVRIGNVKMFQEIGHAIPDDLAAKLTEFGHAGKPTMLVMHGDLFAGVLALADQPREETPKTLASLRASGIEALIMLTGDNERVASAMAQTVGLTDFRADLMPEQKVDAIKELIAKYGQVAMVGDGVNDAPALANATVGIAMGGGGTDVALETGDVALMSDDLSKLPFAVGLSRQSKRIIKQNLFISLGVIALLVPATLSGYANIAIAVIFHEGSTLVVVANALRLLRFRLKDTA